MNAFVTETLPEDLDVLLFSQSPVLADLFADHLEQHGLQVTQKSSDVASLSAFLESGLSSTWYKVFWVDDVSHLSIDQAKKMTQIFQQIKGLSYVVMHQPFSYQGHKPFELIGQKLSDIATFFEQRSPYTSLLTFRDLLSNELFSLNYQQIIHFLHQSRFPFTEDQIGFLNDREVMEGLVTLSFDPRGGKRRVVVSKRPLLTKTLMKAIQNEFRRRFKGEEVLLQREVRLDWVGEFKEFALPSSAAMDEIVSELIVQAKFHYQPAKVTQELAVDDIPKPKIPKARPVEDLPKPAESVQSERPKADSQERKEERTEERIIRSTEVSNEFSRVRVGQKHATTSTQEFLQNLPLSELVPKSIQESSIQVKVTAPVANIPKRAPVLIPEPLVPEIRRSKIILNQFSTSLEKRVNPQPTTHQEFHVPRVNPQFTARVHQEQQHEKQKQLEIEQVEDSQKKQLEMKIATMFQGTLKQKPKLTFRRKERLSPIQVLFGRETRIGKWARAQKTMFWFGLAVSLTTVSLVGLFFISVNSLQKNLLKVTAQFDQGEISAADTKSLTFSQKLLNRQLLVYSTFMGSGLLAETYSQVELAQKLLTLADALQQIQDRQVQTVRQVLGAEEGDPVTTLIPSLGQTDTVYKQLSLLEAELKDPDSASFFATKLREDQQESFIDSIGEIRKSVLIGQQLTEVLPNILNKEQKKTVAIVLQDAQELRATGGFLQTVALVTLTEGKVSDVKIVKPDSLSDRISGRVIPPDEVTQYLGEQDWFLRDANWNPHFDVTSKQIQFFLEKGLDIKVDAVLGLNTNSLAKIIGTMGSVTLKDFDNESVTEKNFAEREFFHAKASLSSSAPSEESDFLSSVFEATLKKLQTVDESQAKELLSVLAEQLKQAEITISFADLATETTFSTLGWTGAIIKPPCPTQIVQDQCLVSRMFQVDSNVGVNKVNYSIKKKVDHAIQIEPEKTIHQRTVTYENSSSTNSWPGGAYKNYVRWYMPAEAQLRAVTINGKAVEADKINQYEDKNSKVVGVLVEILPETTSKVVIEYEEESIGKQASYAFFDQKQPGTGTTPTKITIFYDEQFTPTVIAPEAEISGEKIVYSFWGGEHSFVGVKFR